MSQPDARESLRDALRALKDLREVSEEASRNIDLAIADTEDAVQNGIDALDAIDLEN